MFVNEPIFELTREQSASAPRKVSSTIKALAAKFEQAAQAAAGVDNGSKPKHAS